MIPPITAALDGNGLAQPWRHQLACRSRTTFDAQSTNTMNTAVSPSCHKKSASG
jgi:hypothetical protein